MQKALVMQKSANKWQVQFLASVSTVGNEKGFTMSWKQIAVLIWKEQPCITFQGEEKKPEARDWLSLSCTGFGLAI